MKKLVTLFVAVMLSLSVVMSVLAADTKAPAAKPAEAAKGMAVETGQAAMLDINSATEAELRALPGIGETYSKKIIDGRPYAKKDQLVSKKILPKATYDKIKNKIVSKQPKK